MFTEKAQFDAAIAGAIVKTRAQMASINLYDQLVQEYTVYKNQDLKFLADMPYQQGRDWVDRTFALFMDLHETDPNRYPIQSASEVVKTMRAYRKSQNKLKKKTPSPYPPTPEQREKLDTLGFKSGNYLVRIWSDIDKTAAIEHCNTHEILEISLTGKTE